MNDTAPHEHWLHNFGRALAFLRPHRRQLIIGLFAAVGVSLFYTFSVSSLIPVLKIIFAEHESLADWLYRTEAQHRLGVALPADLPEDPSGLEVANIRDVSPNTDKLTADDRIIAVGGTTGSSYEITRLIARHKDGATIDIRVVTTDGPTRSVTLTLRDNRPWWPLIPHITSVLPSGRTPGDRFRTLAVIMLTLVIINTLGAFCRFVNDGSIAIAVQRATHDLRRTLADHTLRLPLHWHSRQPAGDTLARFATDISKVEVGTRTLFGKVVREPLKALGVLALTLAIDWHMLVIGLVGLPIGVVCIRFFGRMVKRAQRRASQSWGRLLDHLGERLAGVRVVKAFNMQAAESRRFENEDRELTRAQTHIELVDAGSRPALEMIAVLAISAFILYGGARVFDRELEPSAFFGAVICLGGIFDPIRKMGNVMNRLHAADASAARIFEIIDLPLEEPPTAPTTQPTLPPLRESIEFEGVWFSYPSNPDRYVLADVNLSVQKGQVVAIVGPNGCGKTTLVSLLLRFFEPTRGCIRIDGQDIADVSLDSLRSQIGLVTQDAMVFSDSVRANIAYGANGVDEDAILHAARLAHVDEFARDLRVEDNGTVTTGYDARVSNRTLSGGQRQRIVLARAILRDPPILVLDEATSQVDAESERKIQEALHDVTQNRTTFIIAHRLSTIAQADLTVVFNNGRIVGLGRHDELRESCPFYVELVRTQLMPGA